ncbi:MAG: histidinol dehydrogenase [Schleiferiaceae bacterium]
MKFYNNPPQSQWRELAQRPSQKNEAIEPIVDAILERVKIEGDRALLELTQQFDGADLDDLQVSPEEFKNAIDNVPETLKQAIDCAATNIETFHRAQMRKEATVETTAGVFCWREPRAIEKVGLYIPGGSAPLFSTVLMLGIPAQIAACSEIILCTPPNEKGEINPAILYTADLLGIKTIYKVGGAQAIAAMTFGTESIPKVYKIFGPGNSFVTLAKEKSQQLGVAIDMPAGPSEVLVIADATCIPEFVAADLLSQAEHGPDSQVVLLTDTAAVLDGVKVALAKQLSQLSRSDIATKALSQSLFITMDNIEDCLAFSNEYAPEHLIIACTQPEQYLAKIQNAGSVFVGKLSCESVGDYASGPNHTLPTNGTAKAYSGVSVDSFVKKITFQKITPQGLQNLGPAIETMAEAEGLEAHKKAVSVRLQTAQIPL